jgi:CubicO group peptidase (beta-lactamase class C family)
MDSKQLANVVDFGTTHGFESLLIVRHGKIVAEAGYAPYYHAGIANRVYSVTKSVISTLMAIACKDGLLDSTNHRVLDFFDRSSIANIDERKKAITVQNLLDMTSGIDWTEHFAPPSSDMEMAASVDWVKFVLDRPMSSVPGEIFNYNSGNPHLLSAILTKLTGMNALEYAWALPDKPVYMAVGRYGQVIMIFPDLDVVAVTTGHKEYPLGEFAESIYSSAKLDTSLPADPVGAKVLADKILEVSTVKPH